MISKSTYNSSRKVPQISQYVELLIRYLRTQRASVLLLAISLLFLTGLQLVIPQIIRSFIDTAREGGEIHTINRLAQTFLAVAIAIQVLSVITAYMSEIVGWTAINHLREDLAVHCLNLDMYFHNVHTPGEMIERIDGDVNALATFFSEFVTRVVGNVLLLAGVLVVLWFEDWRMGAVLTAFALVTLVFLSRIWPLSVSHIVTKREIGARIVSFLQERLSGIEDMSANGAQSYMMHHMFRLYKKRMHIGRKVGVITGLVLGSTHTLFIICNAIGLSLGAYLYAGGFITIGTVYLFFHYTTLLNIPSRPTGKRAQEYPSKGEISFRGKSGSAAQTKKQRFIGTVSLEANP